MSSNHINKNRNHINNSNSSLFNKYFFHSNKTNNNNSKINGKTEPVSISPSKEFLKLFRYNIMPYLSFSDIPTLKSISKLFNILINQKSIKLLILSNATKHFPSHTFRYSIWSHYLSINQFGNETIAFYRDHYSSSDSLEDFYSYILSERDKLKSNSSSSYLTKEKIALTIESFDYIKRDVPRTFYNDRFTYQNGKEELRNVLEALSSLKDSVGYCQGMNFICGAFICLLQSESKAFWVVNALLKKYELSNLFAYNTPDYGIRVYQLNYYVKKYLPDIYYHFKNNGLPYDLLYSKWLMTILSHYFGIDNLDWPWTCFIIDKWKGLIKTCLVILYDLQSELIKHDMEGISNLVKDNYMHYHLNWNRSNYLYTFVFKVTKKELKELHEAYFIELAKEKLASNSEWEKDQMNSLQKYQKEKGKINAIVKKDISNYKQLMEDINRKYLLILGKYNEEMRIVRQLKGSIDLLAESKLSYEEMFNIYKNEVNQLVMKSNMISLKSDETVKIKKRTIEENKKRDIIEKEMEKILERYVPVLTKYEQDNMTLMNTYEVIDKIKIELEEVEKEKNKRKDQMEKYLIITSKKEAELLKILSSELRLSENYMKTNKF